MFYQCFSCKKVFPLIQSTEAKCPGCGSTNGKQIDSERVKEGLEAGVFFNIDPKTGNPTKKERR